MTQPDLVTNSSQAIVYGHSRWNAFREVNLTGFRIHSRLAAVKSIFKTDRLSRAASLRAQGYDSWCVCVQVCPS